MQLRFILRLLPLVLCISIALCGCGSQPATGDGTDAHSAPTQSTETTAPHVTTAATPVYETRTVWLCTLETQLQYESNTVFKKGYAYDSFGRKAESWRILEDGSRDNIHVYSYDEAGNNILELYDGTGRYERTFDDEGRMLSQHYYSGEECLSEEHYSYNVDGYLIKKEVITRYTDERIRTYQITYEDNYSKGFIQSYFNGEMDGHTEETYNERGQVTFSKSFSADGSCKSIITYAYDDNGRLILEQCEFTRETQADYNVIYTYDDNGLLIRKNVDYYYGNLVEYTYEAFEIQVQVN
jgi:hypothetical protein